MSNSFNSLTKENNNLSGTFFFGGSYTIRYFLQRSFRLSLFVIGLSLLFGGFSSVSAQQTQDHHSIDMPMVIFQDDAADSGVPKAEQGSQILAQSIPLMEELMRQVCRDVLDTIYFPEDSGSNINSVAEITLILKSDPELIAEKYDIGPGLVGINLGAEFITDQYAIHKDYSKVAWSVQGVLSHEFTHVYQFGPKNCGGYQSGTDCFGFIEGLADFVRIQLGLHDAQRRPGGNWNDGYTTTGYFIKWLVDTKDSDFARRLNGTTRDYTTWSWDSACLAILGQGIQTLWNQYQVFLNAHTVEEYLVGDWDGDGRDNLAVRQGNRILMDTDFDTTYNIEQVFGRGDSEDQYLVGDWDRDGRDNIAVRRGNRILMDINFDTKYDLEVAFGKGNSEDEYFVIKNVVTGVDSVGVRRGNHLYIARETGAGPVADETHYGKGNSEDRYLFADWQGQRWDTLAVRRGNRILIDLGFDGKHDWTLVYGKGNAEDEYFVGDWDGDGKDNLAVRRGNRILMDIDFDGKHDITQIYGRQQ
jgi:hypothetical protein